MQRGEIHFKRNLLAGGCLWIWVWTTSCSKGITLSKILVVYELLFYDWREQSSLNESEYGDTESWENYNGKNKPTKKLIKLYKNGLIKTWNWWGSKINILNLKGVCDNLQMINQAKINQIFFFSSKIHVFLNAWSYLVTPVSQLRTSVLCQKKRPTWQF